MTSSKLKLEKLEKLEKLADGRLSPPGAQPHAAQWGAKAFPASRVAWPCPRLFHIPRQSVSRDRVLKPLPRSGISPGPHTVFSTQHEREASARRFPRRVPSSFVACSRAHRPN